MTLIELLIVIVVVAILSSIAVSNYRPYVLRSNRTDATGALLRIQVAEEKFFLQNNTYTTDAISAPPAGLGVVGAGGATVNGYYTVTVTADPNSSNNIATSYLATATATGSQTKDTSCTTLTINDQGQRGSSPSATTTCWK
jgi:type IV pilus assembly protein PilE